MLELKENMRFFIISAMAAGIIMLLISTAGCYLMQQGVTLLRYQFSAEPVSRLLADEDTPEKIREFLQETELIRTFARESLGLEPSKHYTTFVEIDRNYLLALVSAADEFSLSPHTWRFPLVGEVPYKGFFKPDQARREVERLEQRGYDTWISGVNAFSSLDILTDPLYSFMVHYSTYRLSDLIIHELVHSTVWVKGHTAFNEQLAMFVGNKGARQYVLMHYGRDSREYRDIELQEQDQHQFRQQISILRRELEELYSRTDISEKLMRQLKQELFISFQDRIGTEYEDLFLSDRYRFLADTQLNNAYIAIQGVYHSRDDRLERFYRYAGGLMEMIELLKPLDGTRKDPYEYMLTMVKSGS